MVIGVMSDKTLRERLTKAILDADLPDAKARLIEAAWHGTDALDAALRGEQPGAAPQRTPAPALPTAYLQEVTVKGFRGIGPPVTLRVPAGNGLTVVLGRNGSGKSSLAEGLELLITGETARWSARKTKVWTAAWRNLHDGEDPRIDAIFAVEGRDPMRLSRAWTGDTAGSHELQTDEQQLHDLGWTDALGSYRPFLPYAELESWAEKSTQIFDAVNAALGLNDLDETADVLWAAFKRLEADKKAAKSAKDALDRALPADSDDPRIEALRGILSGRKHDLDAAQTLLEAPAGEEGPLRQLQRLAALKPPSATRVKEAVTRLRDAAAAMEAAAASNVQALHDKAQLLTHVLKFHASHGDGPCPVCGEGALDPTWRANATSLAEQLEEQAGSVSRAARRLADAKRGARALLDWRPPESVDVIAEACAELTAAAAAWAEAPEGATQLAEHLEDRHGTLEAAASLVREAATVAVQERQSAWRPLAAPLARWLEQARAAEANAETRKTLKEARAFVQGVSKAVRQERFEPIAGEAKALWSQLRAGSSVDLVDLALKGTGAQRKVELAIQVDDRAAPALGVMSQGELNALALSLFLPRACLPGSPFGFVIIDDPVQSMDPARVDGLARVLHETAKRRQVVVFTHDDRLTEALRRLQLPATVLWVERGKQSKVEITQHLDPVSMYLDDARAIAHTESDVGDTVIARVIPGLCRLALEQALCRAYRRKALGRGTPHREVEDALREANKLRQKAALLLFGNAARQGEVGSAIRNRFPSQADAFFAADKGAHTGRLHVDAMTFVRDCEDLATRLEQLS